MGIPKVWDKLSSVLQDSHLSSFKGKKVALDFSILVHTATHAFTLSKQNTALMSTYGRMGEKSKTTEQRELEEQKREDEVRNIANNTHAQPAHNQAHTLRQLTPPSHTRALARTHTHTVHRFVRE